MLTRLGQLIRSPQMQDLLARYNEDSIIGLHPALANMDRIQALIYREKLAFYPDGQDLNALQLECDRNEYLKVCKD